MHIAKKEMNVWVLKAFQVHWVGDHMLYPVATQNVKFIVYSTAFHTHRLVHSI